MNEDGIMLYLKKRGGKKRMQWGLRMSRYQTRCSWQQVFSLHLTFCAWHVSGVIMEPHCVPAVRESAGLCLIALRSSRPQAGFPRSAHFQKCMIHCSNGLDSQIQSVTLVSIRILLLFSTSFPVDSLWNFHSWFSTGLRFQRDLLT